MDKIEMYFDEQARIAKSFPVHDVLAAYELVIDAYSKGGTIYGLANGGNAGTLDHAFCDFKHHPFVSDDKTAHLSGPVQRLNYVNLAGSAAELTALVNDLGAEAAYVNAMRPFLGADDLVMAYSGSGNSANIVAALIHAKETGAKTFAMTKGNGGRCRELADVCLVVPGTSSFPGQTGGNDNNFHFEDAMLSLNHIFVGLLKEHVATAQRPSATAVH